MQFGFNSGRDGSGGWPGGLRADGFPVAYVVIATDVVLHRDHAFFVKAWDPYHAIERVKDKSMRWSMKSVRRATPAEEDVFGDKDLEDVSDLFNLNRREV